MAIYTKSNHRLKVAILFIFVIHIESIQGFKYLQTLTKIRGNLNYYTKTSVIFFSKTDKHIKLISIHTYQLTCSFSGNSKNPKSFPLMNYKTSHQNYAHGYIPICNVLKIINTISSQTFNHKILVNSKYANEPSRNSQAILVALTTIEEPEEL